MSDNGLITLNSEVRDAEVLPRPAYAQRIQRTHELAGQCTGAAELLAFYARLAFLQQHVFESLSANAGAHDNPRPDAWPLLDDRLARLFPDFMRSLAEISPSAMRDRAKYFATSNASERLELLTNSWNGTFGDGADADANMFPDRFVARAFLQPYAEWLAQGHGKASLTHGATCPVCSSEPACAVLRDQYHGARRGLICSLCMHEWSFSRVKCPSCGEERFEALAVFTPEVMPHVRVDACDTCKRYIKTVDMTKDGNAVAVVDELAAVSLDLWARDQGYTKPALNVAGL